MERLGPVDSSSSLSSMLLYLGHHDKATRSDRGYWPKWPKGVCTCRKGLRTKGTHPRRARRRGEKERRTTGDRGGAWTRDPVGARGRSGSPSGCTPTKGTTRSLTNAVSSARVRASMPGRVRGRRVKEKAGAGGGGAMRRKRDAGLRVREDPAASSDSACAHGNNSTA
jgi:hypothetical protein